MKSNSPAALATSVCAPATMAIAENADTSRVFFMTLHFFDMRCPSHTGYFDV
jgi:hypothetical protein